MQFLKEKEKKEQIYHDYPDVAIFSYQRDFFRELS